MKRREPAIPVLIQDLLQGTREGGEADESGPRAYVITRSGARVYRAVLSGVIMEKEDIGSAGTPLFRLRIADPTGGLSFTVGRYGQTQLANVGQLTVPTFATIVGKVCFFTSKRGEEVMTINPELIVPTSKTIRDSWHKLASRDALARLWAMTMDEPVPLSGFDGQNPEVPRGGEEAIESTRDMVKQCLLSIDRPFFSRAVDEHRNNALEKKVSDVPSSFEEYEGEVVQMIVSLDKGDGARWDDLVDHINRRKLSRDIIEEVVSNLLDKGLLYEPILGYLKAI
jgi:RPA family protein